LWAKLERHGIRSLLTHTHGHHHPHLSFVVLRTYDRDAVQRAVEALPDEGPFKLSFHGVVVFPRGRVCAVPSITSSVLRRQELVEAAVRGTGADVHRHYAYGEWVPHISLTTRATGSDLPVVAKAVTDVLPLTLSAARAALIESSTGETWPLRHVP
jgi:hypothetical protein